MKYRLRENQHGNILVQVKKGRLWQTVERYANLEEYTNKPETRIVTFRGPREKAQIVE